LMSAGMPMPLSRARISTESPRSRVDTFRIGQRCHGGAKQLVNPAAQADPKALPMFFRLMGEVDRARGK
jgi:hypothetical protein